ncbi:fluoride efflux transporter FluC [Curtobacterium sp. RRHDQ10]|uniref:fluoride efflux transporter FluC n=1 Tax=Curtobacterium phyllosphaerae TaxID=3413379 RepID=UPI003BF1CA6E
MDHPTTRPVHLRPGLVLLVALGGAVGTALRAVLAEALPPVSGWSWAILAINVVGAFCLGLLLGSLAARGEDVGRRRTLRVFVGTGILGGFTTYSTLAVDVAEFLRDGRVGTGSGYAALTVVAGLVAVVVGLLVARQLRPRPSNTDPAERPTAQPDPGRGRDPDHGRDPDRGPDPDRGRDPA